MTSLSSFVGGPDLLVSTLGRHRWYLTRPGSRVKSTEDSGRSEEGESLLCGGVVQGCYLREKTNSVGRVIRRKRTLVLLEIVPLYKFFFFFLLFFSDDHTLRTPGEESILSFFGRTSV